jgi:hypothetical protein
MLGESRYAQQRLWNSHFQPSTFMQACGEHLGCGIASHAPSDKTFPRKRVFPVAELNQGYLWIRLLVVENYHSKKT